jgi:RNA polymerase sigma factor (sigma-70 family)
LPLCTLIRRLGRAAGPAGDGPLADAELLDRWVGRRDQAAFELLLWRHGPLVLAACRRLLRDRHAAEDAFQATWLVFVRRAPSIRRPGAVAAWLHRVACRLALRARAAADRRARREGPAADPPAPPEPDALALRDLRAVLDEEVDRLPARFRRAFILCCLEGKTQEEAARLLGRPRGTVSSWLTRARARLRRSLLRRGVAVSMSALAAPAADGPAAALAPLVSPLVSACGAVAAGCTLPAGTLSPRTIALAERTLRTMLLTRVKIATAAVLLSGALFAAGLGTFSRPTQAAAAGEKEPAKTSPTGPAELNPDEGRPGSPTRQSADGIAWGEPSHGLQAGLAFRPGDDPGAAPGGSVTFIVHLRNVGTREVRLTHAETLFLELMPTVEDAKGNRLAVAAGPVPFGEVPLVRRAIKPGQTITLGYPWLRVRPPGWHGEVRGPTCCAAAGRYRVRYAGLPLRLEVDRDATGPATGSVDLDIRGGTAAADARPAAAAGGRPTVAQMLFFTPHQEGVVYSTPAADRQAGCKVDLVKGPGRASGWVLEDEDGKVLRRFLDTNGDNRVDVWSYYKDGVEVYREIDTTFTGKPDSFLWFNAAPSRPSLTPAGPDESGAGSRGTGTSVDPQADAKRHFAQTRTFKIPFRAGTEAGRLRSVRLYASADGGATYELVDKAPPTAKSFHFRAPQDGVYHFAIQTESEDGRLEPADVGKAAPALAVCVDTTPPAAEIEAVHRRDARYGVRWRVSDDNLDLPSLRLEYRRPGEAEWADLPVRPATKGVCSWALPGDHPLEVRLRVRDRAGNETTAVLSLKPGQGPP